MPDSHKRLMTFFRWAAKEKYGDGELRVRWNAGAKGQSRGVVRARTLFLDDMELHRVKREQTPKNGNALQ